MATPLRRSTLSLLALVGLLAAAPAMANGWEHGAIPFTALTDALKTGDDATRARAARSLGFRGQREAVPPLLAALARGDDSPQARSAYYLALGRLGDPRALPALAACLDGGEARRELRADCAGALGLVGDPAGLSALL
ncbi:MAG: HEAT repeat domain-containing protein, partial [Rhodobacterales bacterium]|nr:HEAT repeat domain-containing protein [Rhodobacterales bacterium]